MTDLRQVVERSLKMFQDQINQESYRNCERIANELITVSVRFEFRDGTLIGELLESISRQIRPLSRFFEIEEEDYRSLKVALIEHIDEVARTYRKKDKNELYEALRNLRASATEFQYKCFNTIRRRKTEPLEIDLGPQPYELE